MLQEQQNNVAYLAESPAYRMVVGILTILLGFGIIGCVIITVAGISRSGEMNFFVRMMNTVKSWSSDYYDIRTEGFDESSITVGEVLKKTNADTRKVPACLRLDKSKHCFFPGAFGTTTFYITPNKPDRDLEIELKLDVYGVTKNSDGELVRLSDMNSDNTADKLIDGHILFFKEYNGSYSGLLENGKLTYETSEHLEDRNNNGEYEVTVYWIWPEYYNQLIDVNAEGAVITDSAASDEMRSYIAAHKGNYFYEGEGKSKTNDPSKQYDNADLLIHQNIDYYGFEIIALN